MKPFSKNEILGIALIFGVLVAIATPNFALSLRRARDQTRRDDLGNLQHSLDEYLVDFGGFPLSTPDGRILNCTNPEDKVTVKPEGVLSANLRPCEWGVDAFRDLTPGSDTIYIPTLPRDPDFSKGVSYMYFTDGSRYQLLAYMEGGKDEAEYDASIVARNIRCGTEICNVGRSYNVPINISIEEYDRQLELERLKSLKQQKNVKK